ncbi:speriolin-like [Paramacrobiotus metropolitanus]|uniref:speriolin-like n=1 Tax=Paramacrobiotus metropolitanus TaxID=2943436 RepID=UPI0024464646|nr:speriolin-like [Paramacrobiotus metropolitanus]
MSCGTVSLAQRLAKLEDNVERLIALFCEKNNNTSAQCSPANDKSPAKENHGCARRAAVPAVPSLRHYAVVGELAFQLERRVLTKVWPQQTRFYGFAMRNMESIIAREVDLDAQQTTQRRYCKIMKKLQKCGYVIGLHGNYRRRLLMNTGYYRSTSKMGILVRIVCDGL